MAASTHGEVRSALAIVADIGDEPTVGRQRRIDLGGDHGLDFGREFIITGQSRDRRRGRTIRIADHQTLALGEIEYRTLQSLDIIGGDDHLETVMGPDFIGESGGEELVETEVVAEIFAGGRHDRHPQAELVAFVLAVTGHEHLGQGGLGDGDDGLATGRTRSAGRSAGHCLKRTHGLRLPAVRSGRRTLAEFHAATPALPATQMSATTTPPDTSDAIARQRSIGVLAVLAAVLFFSISSTLIKWADAPGPAIAFWRMVVAVGAWWTVLLIHHLRTGAPLPSRETWRRVTPAGLFFGANIALFFTAIKMTSVAHAEFIGALTPLILLPIGARFFHEPPNWKALRWGILSVAGVIIVLLGGDGGGASSVAGDALMLVVLSLWIGYMLSTKIARQANISTLHFMSCAIPIAVLSAGSISIFLVGGEIMPTTARAWLAIVILAVITGVGAHGLLVFAQRFVPVATIGIMQVAQPAIASFWAWLILGETVTTLQVPGMMLVIVGLTIFTIVSQRRAVLPVIIAQPPDLDGE